MEKITNCNTHEELQAVERALREAIEQEYAEFSRPHQERFNEATKDELAHVQEVLAPVEAKMRHRLERIIAAAQKSIDAQKAILARRQKKLEKWFDGRTTKARAELQAATNPKKEELDARWKEIEALVDARWAEITDLAKQEKSSED